MSADPLATHTQSEMSPFDEWALRLMLDTFEPGPPHAKTMNRTRRVPGYPGFATTAWDA